MKLHHPYTEGWAAVFHGGFASWFAVGVALCALGTWAHTVSALRHLEDWRQGKNHQ